MNAIPESEHTGELVPTGPTDLQDHSFAIFNTNQFHLPCARLIPLLDQAQALPLTYTAPWSNILSHTRESSVIDHSTYSVYLFMQYII